MSKKETTVVVKQDANAVARAEIGSKALSMAKGPDEFGLSASDIRIPILMLMQPASGMVSDQRAKLGDIVINETEKVLTGIGGDPLEVIGLYKFDTVRSYAAADGKFIKEETYTGKIDKEGVIDGVAVRRYHTINWFVLLVKDIEAGEGFPVLMRFKSSSFQAGNKFASFLYIKRMFNKLPFDYTCKFGVERRQNEKKQNWAALSFKEGRETTAQEKDLAKQMVAVINAKRYTVMDAEDLDDSDAAPAAAKPVVVEGVIVGDGKGPY